MKHIIVNNYGLYLGLTSHRLTIKKKGELIEEVALSRVKTIQVLSRGISLSSDLIQACAARGIKIFFASFNTFSALHTLYEHKSVAVRHRQYLAADGARGMELARLLIVGKLKNQRATMLYATRSVQNEYKSQSIAIFDALIAQLGNKKSPTRGFILGIEGSGANRYFEFIKYFGLFPPSFEQRTKRHSEEITNIALNYGYAILFNFIYKACINAGLEPYSGVLHSERSAKPSLVLDIMEEYRSFVVDRNIIKLRKKLAKASAFEKVKRDVADAVVSMMGRKYIYHGRRLSLESIIQRQVYRLSGYFGGETKYKPHIFRW
jgi:CRISPR-associated protein Cas1